MILLLVLRLVVVVVLRLVVVVVLRLVSHSLPLYFSKELLFSFWAAQAIEFTILIPLTSISL